MLVNKIDLLNETTIMLCTYCMFTFTGLVPSPEARYSFGWVMVALILGLMVGFNLAITLYTSMQNLIKWLKLRLQKKRNYRLM